MVTAKWNHENEGFNFVKYFENMLIQVSSIWIAEKSGSIFVHFCPTFRISLVLQLSFESSKICEIENQSERNVLIIHRTFEQFFSPKKNDFDKWGTFKASYRVTWIRRKIYFLLKFLFKTLICGFTQTSKAKILEPTQISGTRIPSHERSLTLFTHSRISKVSRI